MISLIEALNYRCLRFVHQPLDGFHVLVGANASGKTTFLDVITFLRDVVSIGPEYAVRARTENFEELTWNRRGATFELAVEASIPKERQTNGFDTIRYEIAIGLMGEVGGEIGILAEKALLKPGRSTRRLEQTDLFPFLRTSPQSIMSPQSKAGWQVILNKSHSGNDNFYSEVRPKGGKGWVPSFKLGARRSTLGNLPADESRFPAAAWLKELLTSGVKSIVLDSLEMRLASPPNQPAQLSPDGANLPWVVHRLQQTAPERFDSWVRHVRSALPDVEGIRTIEREDDRHRYLVIDYRQGLSVPSWLASDGTLRLLALSLPAYLPDFTGIYLVEEPENGIHPLAIEAVTQSLASVYDAQILLATHSPVILSVVDVGQVLCFAKTAEGATDIVVGKDHPALRNWLGETNLGVLFAAGVLG